MNVMNGRSGCNWPSGNAGNFRGNMNQRNVPCRQNNCAGENNGSNCGMSNGRSGCGQNDCEMNRGRSDRGNGCCDEEDNARVCGVSEGEMQRMMDSCGDDPANCGGDTLYGMPLAMGYVPWQQWGRIYNPAEGLSNGTIFPELDLQFFGCIPKGWPNGRGGRA